MENIIWIKELTPQDTFKVGRKAIEIYNLTKLNIPVPTGFVVSGLAFKSFLEKNNIDKIIATRITGLDLENTSLLEEASYSIQNLILESNLDIRIKEDILEAYDNLDLNLDLFKNVSIEALNIMKAGKEHPFVVLRSNFAGDFSSEGFNIFNVKGNNSLIENVKKSWASLFNPDSISKMIKDNLDFDNLLVSIIIQKQVQPNKSGIIYQKDNNLIFEAGLGLINPLLTNRINPDFYYIGKDNLKIMDKKINRQEYHDVLDINLNRIVQRSLSEDQKMGQKLNDFEILKLAEISKKIEDNHGPKDIEFAIEGGNLLVMQTKPSNSFRKEEPLVEEEPSPEPEKQENNDYEDYPLWG